VRGIGGRVDCVDEMQEKRWDFRKGISSQTRYLPTDNRTLAKADEPPRQARWGWNRSAQTPLSLPQWIQAFALRDFLGCVVLSVEYLGRADTGDAWDDSNLASVAADEVLTGKRSVGIAPFD